VTRPLMVTAALPYANGQLHIGHLVEYIQADMYVRAQRQTGRSVHFFCAADAHGTPIEINAREQGISPEDLVADAHAAFVVDFKQFGVSFDAFHTTHCPENRALATEIYEELVAGGDIVREARDQYWCDVDQRFLPDRFVRGECPKCGGADQYGDNCELCGATYAPTDLRKPACALCGTPPTQRSSERLFFDLPKYGGRLGTWMADALAPGVRRFVEGFVEGGLRLWDISRDGPYFGFEIPGETNKFFYVWLDAPVGYMATARHWASAQGAEDPDYFWRDDSIERLHVIGKDIVYFHSLFWPAILMASGWALPHKVQVHGFLQVEGAKMSKSRGTCICAAAWAEFVEPELLRYYYASRLSDGMDDLNLDFEDFVNTINGELINKFVNLASRSIGFVNKKLDNSIGDLPPEATGMLDLVRRKVAEASDEFTQFRSAQAIRALIEGADAANTYLQDAAPWVLFKSDPEAARPSCSAAIQAVAYLFAGLAPVLPQMSATVGRVLGEDLLAGDLLERTLGGRTIARFERLANRLDREPLDALVEHSKNAAS
jgi:methionyl-tRNA synthetase